MDWILKLKKEVGKFKSWAKTHSKNFGEWEVLYPNWDNLYQSAKDVIEKVKLDEIDDETISLLLYTLARDNEDEYMLEHLVQYPDKLLLLAKFGLLYSEVDARWQLAYGLRTIKDNHPQAKELLMKYCNDEEEYVRRRAQAALNG